MGRASARAVTASYAVALSVVAWGAFAFGAVYPWGYWTLAILCLVCGFARLIAARTEDETFTTRRLVWPLALVALAVLLQVVPLPLSLHRILSPAAASLLPNLDFFYGARLVEYRALSVVPGATLKAFGLYLSFGVLLLAVKGLLDSQGPRRLADGLAIIGVLVALAGVVQQPFQSALIYGVWQPEIGGKSFGPFVNRNHFAGWMLMVLPIALALLCTGIERSMRGLKPGWRHRLLWLSSPEASRLILLAAGVGVMALALVLTMSRSGITALAMSLFLTGWFVARGIHGGSRKVAGAAYLAALAVTLVAWIGVDTLANRFAASDWSEFNNRRGAWADAWTIAKAFPLTGAGLNTYDTLATYYQRHDPLNRFGEAHNDYLQLAAEGGLLVGIPVLICAFLLGREIWRQLKDEPGSTSWWLRRGALTALLAIGFQEAVDFSLQIPGNAALFAVICAIAIHKAPVRKPPSDRPRLVTRSAGPLANDLV